MKRRLAWIAGLGVLVSGGMVFAGGSGDSPLAPGTRDISLDKSVYGCSDDLTITVVDNHGTSPANVSAATTLISRDPSGALLDSESGISFSGFGTFTSSTIPVDESAPVNDNGVLSTVFRGSVSVDYDPGGGAIFRSDAAGCRPTQVTGTASGTVNGIAVNATINGTIDYDGGFATVNIVGIPASLGEDLEAYGMLGTFAGAMSSKVLGDAIGPGELTRGNFTRVMTATDVNTSLQLTTTHVLSYGGTGNSSTVSLTMNGSIPNIDPLAEVAHMPWTQAWSAIGGGNNIELNHSQGFLYVPDTGIATNTWTTVTGGHGGMGTITPTCTVCPTLTAIQARLVPSYSVSYNAGNQTLTINSTNRMGVASVVPTMGAWGVLLLTLLLATAIAFLHFRRRRAA